MPIIRVELLAGRTHEQKAQLTNAITDAMVNIGKAKRESVWIMFTDLSKENFAEGGALLSDSK